MSFLTWKRWFSTLSVAVVALVILAACGGGEPPVAEDVTAIPNVPGAPDFAGTDGTPAAGGQGEAAGGQGAAAASSQGAATGGEAAQAPASERVRLNGGDIYFDPTEITIPVGGVIELVNVGAAQHNFAIEGYNDEAPVDMPIGGEVVEWTVPDDLAPGTYTFYCEIPGHRAAGMQGTITIVEASSAAGQEAAAQAPQAGAEATASEVVRLEGGDIYFEPTEITIPVGGTIELVNIGASQHDFVIEGYNDESPVDMPIGGEPVQFVIPPDLAPGTYTFYCSIPGHRQNGMEGTITIVEAGAAEPAAGAQAGSTPAAAGTPAGGTPVAGSPGQGNVAAAAGQPQTLRVEGGDIYFEPTELTVRAGDVIELVNVGLSLHDFVVEGYNDDEPVEMPIGGEVIQWTVPADLAPGEYVFYCSIPGHRTAGMWGTLIVQG